MKTNGRRRHALAARGEPRVDASRPVGGTLLIVDPEELTRWAIASYFSRLFTVISVATAKAACHQLDRHPVEAMIISNDLPDIAAPPPCRSGTGDGIAAGSGKHPPADPHHAVGADGVEFYARQRNPFVMVVRTTTDPGKAGCGLTRAVLVEKPFKLASLAEKLGATVPTP